MDWNGREPSTPQAFGADIEHEFAKVLDTLDRSYETQVRFPGSRIDFSIDGKTVDLKGRRLGNWTLADGSLNVQAITSFELKNLEESVKHANATKLSETMLYVVPDASPQQLSAYKELLRKVHASPEALALKAQLPTGTTIGLGVTSRSALKRASDVYYTGVWKRLAGTLSRLKKPGKGRAGLIAGALVALFATSALASEHRSSVNQAHADESIEIESFDSLRATVKDVADGKVVDAIISSARNAIQYAIMDEAKLAKSSGVEDGHFVLSDFNPVGLLPGVGDYLDSTDTAAPVAQNRSFMDNLRTGIAARVDALKARLHKIGTPLTEEETHAITEAMWSAWGTYDH